MGKLFGTDGVRGIANRDLTGELAYRLGRAAVIVLAEHGERRPHVALGRDTRASGEFLEAAMAAGICSAGGDAVLLGVCTTPGVAYLTTDLGAAAGAVISASHNPAEYNGIKFFGSNGYKLPDDVEDEMEAETITADDPESLPVGRDLGRILRVEDGNERYLRHLQSAASGSLRGMRVVVDCANGAASELAPNLLARLGAEVVAINAEPDGWNINDKAGATAPEVVASAVLDNQTDAGVAFDGDADRALFADGRGAVIDGDQVLAASALAMKDSGELAEDTLVTTVMANLGLRLRMKEAGIQVIETKVGDRHVLEEMLRTGSVLGGEQSGHVIFLRHATTGDGLLTAVRFLGLAREKGVSLTELGSCMEKFPQVLINVPVAGADGIDRRPEVATAIRAAEQALGERGRVLVRPSGTEPLVRVMVEAESEEEASAHAEAIAEAVRTYSAPA